MSKFDFLKRLILKDKSGLEFPTAKRVGMEVTVEEESSVDVEPNDATEHRRINEASLLDTINELEELSKTVPPFCDINEQERIKAIDSWKQFMNGFLESENEWKAYILDNYRELAPKYSTGSNSGSLMGFRALRGLIPAGQMLKEHPGQVPYSGELLLGVSKGGVNESNLSFTSNTQHAISYAEKTDFNTTGWNPQVGRENTVKIKAQIKEKEGKQNEPRELWKGRDFFQEELDALRLRLVIEEERQKLWPKLTEMERKFISDPFPLVYGILKTDDMDDNNFKRRGSDEPSDYSHYGQLSTESNKSGQIAVYCPADKISIVQDYLKQKNISIPIHPLEAARLQWGERIDRLVNLVDEMERKAGESKKTS